MKRFLEYTVESITWILFGVAVLLLARQTWFAVQGVQPNYSSELSAYIVAGIVTATWVAMLGRLVLKLDPTPIDWGISLSLLIFGLLIDVLVAFSIALEFKFPAHVALLVIVGHVVAHVVQWIVIAAKDARERFSVDYRTPDQRENELMQKIALLEQSLAMQEQTRALLDEERTRTYTEVCPICKDEFEHRTKSAARRALRAHIGHRHTNGSSPKAERQENDINIKAP